MIDPHHPDFSLHPGHPTRKKYELNLVAGDDKPVITIVTPFYNTGQVFYDTARSIMSQTLQQWEWLIINDGSTEQQALQILDEFRNHDPRIRIIDHPSNRGLSAARNTGVSQAHCQFVLFLDSDDLLEPTAGEKWWWYLETHPGCSFVASYHVAFGGKNYLWTGGFHDGFMNAERNRVSMMCMVRKSVFNAVGGFDEANRGGLEDWDFWMKCAAHGYWGATIPEYLAWYRVRADHSDRWENLHEARINEFQEHLQKKYPHLYQGGFPSLTETVDYDLTMIELQTTFVNQLEKGQPHLLIILPWLVMGGAERFILSMMDQLIERGWMISIVTTAKSPNPWLYEFEKRSPFVFLLPDFLPLKDYPNFLGYLVRSRGFDAVMLQGSQEGYRLLPALHALCPDVPIVDILHFVTPDWMEGGFPKLSSLYRDYIDLSFISCHQVRDWMLEQGSTAEKMEVCYIGVDPQIWKPNPTVRHQVRSELGIGPDETVIIYAARLEAQKQPDIFVKTLARLKEKGDKFRALVAGEGSLLGELKAGLQAHGLQQSVQLLGAVPAEKMPSIFAASDVFFLPSQNEGISQALYEAMACGLPVVVARVGGQGEVVTPECGFLYNPGTLPDEVTQYSEFIHALVCDAQRRVKMSQVSRSRIVEHFSISLMGECVYKTLLTLIANKKSHASVALASTDRGIIERETRTVVEYLQVRQRQKWLEQEYSALITPKSPSHWFYLWLRQLLFPVYQSMGGSGSQSRVGKLVQAVKRRIVKAP